MSVVPFLEDVAFMQIVECRKILDILCTAGYTDVGIVAHRMVFEHLFFPVYIGVTLRFFEISRVAVLVKDVGGENLGPRFRS